MSFYSRVFELFKSGCFRAEIQRCSTIALIVLIGAGADLSRAQDEQFRLKTERAEYVQLTSEKYNHDPSWSPDGRQIAFCRRHDNGRRRIWVMDRDGSNQRQLTFGEGAFDDWYPRWSPDGTRVAFSSSREGLGFWTVPAGGGELYRIPMETQGETGTLDYGFSCAWSPDSKTLVFSYGGEGTNEDIFTISPTDGAKKRLTADSGDHRFPAYNPTGDLISFFSERDGAEAIWIMPSEGGEARKLDTAGKAATFHQWSPDGRWILYQQDQKLWLVPSAGGTPVAALEDSLGGYTAVWSPDGRGIAYTGRINRPADLMLVDGAGGVPQTLVSDLFGRAFFRSRPAWRPDGRGIAYVDRDTMITLLDLDSGAAAPLIKGGSPTWAPDGTRLAFVKEEQEGENLWSVAADGSDPMRLTVGTNPLGMPSWSPDGEWVAYHMRRDGNWDVWMVPAWGGRPIRLTADEMAEGFPVWQGRDSGFVVFASFKPAGQNMPWNAWRVGVDGGAPEFFHGAADSDLMWMSFAPEGKTMAYSGRPNDQSSIYIQNLGTDAPARLLASGGATAPAFSPDGKSVAYYQDMSSSSNIWFADLSALLEADNLP